MRSYPQPKVFFLIMLLLADTALFYLHAPPWYWLPWALAALYFTHKTFFSQRDY